MTEQELEAYRLSSHEWARRAQASLVSAGEARQRAEVERQAISRRRRTVVVACALVFVVLIAQMFVRGVW